MEQSKFLRKFVNLFIYDKPYNSLPILVLMFLLVMGLTIITVAASEEKDVDKSLEAIKDVVSLSITYICLMEQSILPERTLKLIRLIDDEFIVDGDELVERTDDMCLKIGLLHKRKREDLRSKFQYMFWTAIFIFCGYFSKHFLNQIMGIEAESVDENGQKRWPTPFVYPLPLSPTLSYLLYTYTLQVIMLGISCCVGYAHLTSVIVSMEKVLADFETISMLLEYVSNDFPDSSRQNDRDSTNSRQLIYRQNDSNFRKSDANLRADMARIVRCHQIINRNFKICADCSAFVLTALITAIVNDSCSNVFFMLKNNDVKKAVVFTFMLIIENLTLLFVYQNGQRIFNQNDILRRHIAELPWTDKPRWFRQTVHTMMTRANVDTEMRPYGIFVLNLVSFKDMMKFTFSVGNVLYTKKMRSQSRQ